MSKLQDALNKAENESNENLRAILKNTKNVITVQSIIDGLPDNSKYNVLSSLVGAINCSVIGTASITVGRLMTNVPDFQTLSSVEIIHMMSEADMRYDNLRNVRSLIKIRDKLRDQLVAVANDDNISDWPSSIEFMTHTNRTSRLSREKLGQVLSLIGLDEKTIDIMYQASLIQESQDNIRNAENIAQRQGAIEWLIEKVFCGNEIRNDKGVIVSDDYIVDNIEELPVELQNRQFDKLRQALNKALTRCAARFAVGDTRYELNDILIINNLIKEAGELEAPDNA